MAKCEVCEHGGASQMQVEYTTDEMETLDLCDRCAAHYERGGLVSVIAIGEIEPE